MRKPQDFYYMDGKPYDQLTQENKDKIDKAIIKLKDYKVDLEGWDNGYVNIITTHPNYPLFIDTSLPDDLTGKLVSAYTMALGE